MDKLEQIEESSHDVIYTLRTAHQNQTQLLIMADQKANILIGVVAVILTFILTNRDFLNSISYQYIYLFSAFVMLEIASLIMSLLVVLPQKKGASSKIEKGEDLHNPLFFGHFTQLSEQQFTAYIAKILNNDKIAQELLVKDIYNIGLVLKRKYGFLKLAYTLAIIGIIFLAAYAGLNLVLKEGII